MRFSEYFKLDKSQKSLDFVDIDVDGDLPLYLDPFAISQIKSDFAKKCDQLIVLYFSFIVTSINRNKLDEAIVLLDKFHEPNDTHLGVSSKASRGRGVGKTQAKELLSAFVSSDAAQTGLLEDISDCALMIEGIGSDKISDMTTNIIKHALIEYTIEQCKLYNIPTESINAGFYLDADELLNNNVITWKQGFFDLPVCNNKRIILVPKWFVRHELVVQSKTLYNRFYIDYLEKEHLRMNDSLVKTLVKGGKKN